jgi:hypothetical protein
MTDLIIREPLARRIREVAKYEHRSPEEVVEILVNDHIHNPPPRPRESLTNDDIEVPDDEDDPEAYRQAVRAIRPKMYRIARRYWTKVGDTEKLALTDEQLDKVFWLIDHNGVPRFKSEKGTIELPPDPLEALIGLFRDNDVTDASTSVYETMKKHYDSTD